MRVAYLSGGLLACALVVAGPAAAASAAPAQPDSVVSTLSGVPAVGLLAHGRVLVLRPHTLEVALDGRVRRTVVVRQPLDLDELPSLVADPAYATRSGPDGVRLGAVLVQRPDTRVVVTGGRLELADTGGAGPARLTGTRAGVALRGVTLSASTALGAGATPGARIVTAGLRYLHDSDVSLEDVVLRGLGTPGPAGIAALHVTSGSDLRLRRVTLVAGGRGVQADEARTLDVEGLRAQHAAGDVLRVLGGSGARISDVSTSGTGGTAVRLRGTAATALTGLASRGDRRALLASDVAGLRANGVDTIGSGVVVGGRDVSLGNPRVDAAGVALQVEDGNGVVVRGGTLRGSSAATADGASKGVVLEGVSAQGSVRGPVTVRGGSKAASASHWWSGWHMRGAGAVALLVVLGGVLLEVARGRRGTSGSVSHPASGSPDDARPHEHGQDEHGQDELLLDLG